VTNTAGEKLPRPPSLLDAVLPVVVLIGLIVAPEVLSRAVEDSGTVTSPLVPWNTCGAYMSGVLGVSTASYFPYCFFNIASPILDVVYGFLGFKVRTLADQERVAGDAAYAPHG
jgi:Na+/H+ antiporter NhaC